MHRHTIPSFESSKSPFELLLGSRETPHASHPETEEEHCPQRNQRRKARAAWVRCEPSTPRRDPRTGELARSSRRRAQPFLQNHCHSEHNRAGLPGLLRSSSRTRKQSVEGLFKPQPTSLRQRKYSQSVKDQGEDVHSARLCPAL